MATFTPNFRLAKPIIDGDDDAWGYYLNDNADILDAALADATITVSDTPPPLKQGQPWFDSVSTQLFIGYDDGNSSQWVTANSVTGHLPLTGGTVTGPLIFTATGSTTPRSAQDRAAVVANVLDFGAVPTGAADSTVAFQNALATGRNVYVPKGSYIIRNQLTLGNGQEFYGDGRGQTVLLIDQTFSPSATCVISLTGQEYLAPTVRDLGIVFAQPSDQNSRANFKTLAAGGTSGTGGTGVKYPPAIGLTSANRFKLRNLRITRAWDGIITMGSNPIGGFFIRDIEMCAFNVGLGIDNVLDFGHVIGYHMWAFDLSTALNQGVWWDGLTFAAKIGTASVVGGGGGNYTDFAAYDSRVVIANAGSMVAFQGLSMDGNNSTLEISGALMCQISNAYFSGGPINSNPNTAQLNVTGGNVFMTNTYFQAGQNKPPIFVSGGRLILSGGEVLYASNNSTAMTQTGGRTYVLGVVWALAPTTPWTVPAINITGGITAFNSNTFLSISLGDVGGLVITTDNAQHSVSGNFWNGWGFTAPGPLGDYGLNSTNAEWGKQITLGKTGQGGRVDFRRGSDGVANAWLGMDSATGSDLRLKNGSGSSNIIFDSNTLFSFRTGDVQYATSRNTYGNQFKLGYTAQAGRIDFARGSDGTFTCWAGLASAAGTNHFEIANTSGSADIRINPTGAIIFLISGTEVGRVNTTGLTLPAAEAVVLGATTIRSGAGAATGTQPKGSIWIRTDGAAGSTLYVTQGGGVWAAVAGV